MDLGSDRGRGEPQLETLGAENVPLRGLLESVYVVVSILSEVAVSDLVWLLWSGLGSVLVWNRHWCALLARNP